MPIVVWLSAAAVMAVAPVLYWTLASRGEVSTDAVRRNLGVPDLRQARLATSSTERLVLPVLDRLASMGRSLMPAERAERIDRHLALAGLTGRWSAEQVLGAKMVLALTVAASSLLYLSTEPSGRRLAVAGIFVAAGFFTPDYLLGRRSRARQSEMERDLPDVLDQLTISVEAGLAFDAALQRVVRSGSGPLADEFGRMLQDVKVGTRRIDAMEALLERTDSADVRHVLGSLIQADRHGSPLAKTLRLQAAETRLKRRQRAEEAANKIAVKLLFPVVFCLFPSLFIIILGPAIMNIAGSF
jgi:tight adherence protein C